MGVQELALKYCMKNHSATSGKRNCGAVKTNTCEKPVPYGYFED
jgi:hypothetical protein